MSKTKSLNLLKISLLSSVMYSSYVIADEGLFIAAGVSFSDIELDEEFNVDDDTFSYQGRLGYMFNSSVSVEATYFGFDEFNDNASETDVNGYGASLNLTAPLGPIDLYGKGGLAYLDAETRGVNNQTGQSFKSSDGYVEPYVGVGAEIDLGLVNFYTEYTKIIESDDLDVDIFSGGIKLEF